MADGSFACRWLRLETPSPKTQPLCFEEAARPCLLPHCPRNSLCPRLALSSQALILLPRGKCTKTDHCNIKASTPQALGYPLQGFRNTDKMQDAFCIHRGVIFFSALQNMPDLIPETIHIVQSERKLLACSFSLFFPPSFHMAD